MIDAKHEEIVELSRAEEPQAILDVANSEQAEISPSNDLDFQESLMNSCYNKKLKKGGN